MRVWGIIVSAALLAACSRPPDAVQTAASAAQKAADQFVTLAKPATTTGQPPRQTDPTAGPLLDAIFNTSVLQTAPASSDDIEAINNWLLACARAGQVYTLAGTGLTDLSAATSQDAQSRVGQNVVTFAPEFGRYMDAELVIEGADASAVLKSLAEDPNAAKNEQQGLDTARGGIVQTAQGVITTIAGPGLPNDWREARARSLLAFAPHVAPFLNDAQKTQLATVAGQGAATASDDPALAASLSQFAVAIMAKAPA